MFVKRNLPPFNLFIWLSKYIVILLLFNGAIALAYHFLHIKIHLPWLPVSVVGTTVAFFIGFKNNQAYDRMWEARKIWGGIVNDSRTWGMRINNFFKIKETQNPELSEKKKQLIYRHIAWMYTHRSQLLQPTTWEQIGTSGSVGSTAQKYTVHGLGKLDEDVSFNDIEKFVGKDEFDYLKTVANPSTQLLNQQSYELIKLKKAGIIDEFEHLQLEELLRSFFTLQGQNERIKKFPFPRDYSSMSRFFVLIFILLFPFSLIPELLSLGNWAFWISIPIASIIGLLYIIMEDLGDYNENPFMGTPHAMPMLSLCRTIEIDLREMLGETNLPKPIQARKGVLM